ncbi:MAG: porin family protein [Rhodomicrobium sp.]|nr:porin family protein [Rhodomicrobium sp.]
MCAVSAANAADTYKGGAGSLKDTPFVEVPWSWAGYYGGLTLGYGSGTSEHYLDRNDNHDWASNDPDGLIGGATVGYNYQIYPDWVVGAEADLSFADINGVDKKRVYDGHYWFTGWDGLLTLRGRVGYSLGRTLIYGTAGYAALHSAEYVVGNTPKESTDGRGWRSGWVAGLGAEHMFTDRISGKVEYLHVGLEDISGTDMQAEPNMWRSDLDLIRVGVNYKLN